MSATRGAMHRAFMPRFADRREESQTKSTMERA